MRSIEINCAQCGGQAVRYTWYEAGEGEGLWRDKARLVRTRFMGEVAHFGREAEAASLLDHLSRGQYAMVIEVDPDLFACYCQQCQKVYCEKCWRIGGPVFDEGFYDYTLGTCPQGHEQTIDD